jgi:hypothetical protein
MPVNDLDPGEGASVELQVWTEYGLDGCLPTGTYRFEETVSVTPRPGDDAASVPVEGGLVDIEFTLRVASP